MSVLLQQVFQRAMLVLKKKGYLKSLQHLQMRIPIQSMTAKVILGTMLEKKRLILEQLKIKLPIMS